MTHININDPAKYKQKALLFLQTRAECGRCRRVHLCHGRLQRTDSAQQRREVLGTDALMNVLCWLMGSGKYFSSPTI